MIITNICVLGIVFLILNYYCFPKIRQCNITELKDCKPIVKYKNIIIMLISFLLFAIICNIPVIEDFEIIGNGATSIIHLMYSYFDSPSLFAAFLVLINCFKQIIILSYVYSDNVFIYRIAKICKMIRFDGYCALILFIYGLILYGGSLGMIDFDIYHMSIPNQSIIIFLILVMLYISSPQIAYLGLLALLFHAYIYKHENLSFLEIFICPYLLIYCALYIIYLICKSIYCVIKPQA